MVTAPPYPVRHFPFNTSQQRGFSMRIDYLCFILAAVAGTTGICLGIYMGIVGDFSLAPAHAHVNLLGWVTMALYGLYHRTKAAPATRLDWVQVGCGGAGFPIFAATLAYILETGDHGPVPLAIVGALLCLAGMLLFLVIVLLAALRRPLPARDARGVRAAGR
jgi:hypothetical protein